MATNELGQPLQLLREALLADATVVAKVENRVYSDHFVEADVGTPTYPLVVLEPRGGDGHIARHLQRMTVHVYAWSKVSADEARAIYDAVYVAAHMQRLTFSSGAQAEGLTQAGTARETDRPVYGYADEVVGWWARGTWEVQVAG